MRLEIEIDGEKLEQVRRLKYLGATITEHGTPEEEIRIRIGVATNAMIRLGAVWSLSGVSLKTRFRITMAVAWATLLYRFFPSSLSFKCALRESGCRIGYEPTKNESKSLSVVDIQGHQHGGFWTVPTVECESWTVSQKSIQKLKAFEMKCYCRLFNITWREKKTNEYVMERVTELMGGRPESLKEIM